MTEHTIQQCIADLVLAHTSSGGDVVYCWCDERFNSFPLWAKHVAEVITENLQLKVIYGVVSPDDNDVQDFGTDEGPARDEAAYFHDEGLDTAHVVTRLQGPWVRIEES